jgi:hypothetical protein
MKRGLGSYGEDDEDRPRGRLTGKPPMRRDGIYRKQVGPHREQTETWARHPHGESGTDDYAEDDA